MITFRTALLLSFVAGLTACSSGGSDGDEPRVPDPVDGGGQAPVALDFSSTPEGNPVEEERWQYQIETNLADSDFLTFSLVSGPASMTISEEGLVQWTPDDEDGTQVQATVRVIYNDGTNTATAEQTFELTVTPVNDKPEITSVAPLTAVAGSVFQYQLAVNDPDDANDGENLFFTVDLPYVSQTLEEYGVAISSTGLLTWTVPAEPSYFLRTTGLRVIVEVTDGEEDWGEVFLAAPSRQAWNLSVVDANTPPVITSAPVTTATEDTLYTYQLVAEDVAGLDVEGNEIPDDLEYTLVEGPEGMTVSDNGLVEWTPTENGGASYSVQVTIEVEDGGENDAEPQEQSYSITVAPVNDAPVISGTPAGAASLGEAYEYQIAVTDSDDDNDGSSLTFTLLTAPQGMTVSNTGFIQWTPVSEGTFPVVVTVADGGENGALAAEQAWVIEARDNNTAPSINQTAPTMTVSEDSEGMSVLTALDAEGDSLAWSISEQPANGLAIVTNGAVTYTPESNFNGTDAFTVQVTDGSLSDSGVVNVTVTSVNDAPVIDQSSAVIETAEDVSGSVSLTASDVEGDALSWSVSAEASNGTAAVVNGEVTYTPDADFNGSDSFVVEVSDGSDSDTITVTVDVATAADAPVIEQEAASITTDEDSEGSTLLTATDADGDSLSWSIAAQALNGTAIITDGDITYTPNENFNGADSFTVEVSDGALTDSMVVNVTVNAVNDLPVIDQVDVEINTNEDTQGAVSLSATDVEGDTLTWAVTSQGSSGTAAVSAGSVTYQPATDFFGSDSFVVAVNDGDENVTVTINVTVEAVNDAPVILSSAPTSATEGVEYSYAVNADDVDGPALAYSLEVSPAGMEISDEGVITWTPENGVTSADVTLVVTDGVLSAEQSYTILVGATNDAPEITSEAPLSATEDVQYTYEPAATDIDGDSLTWTLSQSPAAMEINPDTGAISWTPTNGVESAVVTLVVSDGALSDSQMFTISVAPVNDAPVISQGDTAGLTTEEDEQGSLQLAATDVDSAELIWSASEASNGTVTVEAGSVLYAPAADFNGTDGFVVTVSDGELTDTITVTVTVNAVNDAPVITSVAPTLATEGAELSYQLAATDADNDSLTYSLTAGPEGMAMSATGLVTWTPGNGVDSATATFTVSDSVVDISQTTTITVAATNDAPVITEGESSSLTTSEDTEGSITLNAQDVDGNTITWTISEAATSGTATVSGTGESQTVSYVPNADFNGSDSFTVQASDGSLSDEIIIAVTVNPVNDAPVIEQESAVITTTEDTAGTVTLTATDVEGDELQWSISSNATSGTTSVVDGLVTYTPDAAFNGSDSFEVAVTDGSETTTITVSVDVSAENDAPVIDQQSASVTTNEDTAGSTTLTATDIDGDSLTWTVSEDAAHGTAAVVGGQVSYTPNANFNGSDAFTVAVSDGELSDSILVSVTVNSVNDEPVIAQGESISLNTAEDTEGSVTLTASDADGDTLTWAVEAAATNGEASVEDGVVAYMPAAGFNGTDSFTVTVSDSVDTDTITINVNVSSENDAPVIDQDSAAITTAEDTAGSVSLSASDIDNEELTWSVSVQPENGSATVVDGNVIYTPAADYHGDDSFTVEVTDGSLSDDLVVDVTVTAVNDAPVFANAASTSAVEGTEYQYQAAIADVDDVNNGTDLTFNLIAAPEGMTVSATGLVSWTPENGATSASVSLEVADGGEDGAAAAVQNWTITVGATNDAPTITSIAPVVAEEGSLYTYDVQVSDPDDENNGTDLTFTLVTAPEGMTISTMGAIQWTPENGVTTANVTVRVADGGESDALPDTQSWTITVTPVNDAPVIDQGDSAALSTTEDVAGSLELSATDIDSDTLTWSISDAAGNGTATVAAGVVSYTPDTDFNGTDSFTVEVTDGDLTDSIVVTVTVEAENDAPVFTSVAGTEATEDEAYSYTAAATDTDGDTLTYSLQTKPVGMTIDADTGVISWTPENGVTTAAVTVAVTDGTATATQSFEITVTPVNDAPVITSTAPGQATEDVLYSYPVVANDVDGDALTYGLTSAPEGMTIDGETGEISWTPANGVESASVTLEVSDGELSDSQTFTIDVSATNDAPVIDQGESATLSTEEDAGQTLALTATDIDGDSLSWSISTGATEGEASVDDNGLVAYMPAADFNGSDSFTVQVSDGESTDSILVNVSVSEVNDAPVVAQGEAVSMTTAEDTQKTLTLNASDVDGDSLSWSVASSATNGTATVSEGVVTYTPNAGYNGEDSFEVAVTDGTATVTVQVSVTVTAENDAPVIDQASAAISTSEDVQGSVTLSATDPEGTALNWSISSGASSGVAAVNASGVVTYDPAENFNGTDSFTVMVSDGDLSDSRVVSVEVAAVNDAPVITEGDSAALSTDEDNMGSVTLNATDVEGDTITWSIQSQASEGTASVSGTGTSQAVNYTPAADFNGSDSFVVRVSDGDLTDTITVNVTVDAANDAPVITSTEVTEATEGEAYSYSVAANDVDGDSLTFSLTEAPEGMTISGNTISWTPENGVATVGVTVSVSDASVSVTQSFTITVTAVNDAPVITSTAATSATEGNEYTYQVVAEDVDSTELTFSLTDAPEGMTITGNIISWTPANGVESASVTVEVTDGDLTDSQSFIITVGATNDAPVIDQGAVATLITDEDTSATLNLTASDVDSANLSWSVSSAPENGTASVDESGVVSFVPADDFNGSDSFEIEVSDGELSDAIVVNVTVNPVADAPVIAEGDATSRTTNEDQPLTFALNASDVDSATITWSISTAANSGTATVSGTGNTQSVNYVPNQNFNGTDNFVVQVSDGSLSSTIAVTVTVTAVNDLPVITSQANTEATEGELYTYLPTATDVEGDTLTWNVGTAPASMSVDAETGELSWIPAEGVTIADVTLLVSDGGANVTQSFTIEVAAVNNAPVITEGESATVTMSEDGSPTAFALVLNATDSDNEGSELTWTVSSDATNGSAAVSGSGLSKQVSYVPEAGFSGSDSFTVEVSDGALSDSIVVNVTVEAVNAAPVIEQGDSTAITLDEDGTQTLSLSATDTDGDSLTWSITSSASNGGVSVDTNGLVTYVPVADFNGDDSFTVQVSDSELTDTISVAVTVNPVNDVPVITEGDNVTLTVDEDVEGTVTFNATDVDGDTLTWSITTAATSGIVTQTGSQFSYSPSVNYSGTDTFSVQVSDGTATGTSTVSVTVVAVNDAPVVTSAPVTSASEYQVYAYDVTASDAEDDAITYSLTTAPAGMEITSAGEIRWIPEAAGDYDIVISAADSADAGTQSFTITVNAEPAVAGRAVKGVLANAAVEAAVYTGLDAEGEHSWSVLASTETDANGYFGFDLGTQVAPVRIRVTSDAETTMVCDTPSGCILDVPALFGESGSPAEGLILDTIVTGAEFAGPIAVTPMTHMAATWLQAFPQALDDNNVLLTHKRLAKVFGFANEGYVNHRVPDLTDAFERAYTTTASIEAMRHAIFAASLQETAVTEGIAVDVVTQNIGLIFGLLGGQMPLKSGVIDVTALNLEDGTTEISYAGFDTFVENATTVGGYIDNYVESNALTAMVASFGELVTMWNEEPAIPDNSICLVTDDPDLDRSECRNVTTVAESTGYDAANFARALAPINVAETYYLAGAEEEAEQGDRTNRDLGWMYVDATAQENTANLLAGFSAMLGKGLEVALCVPQQNNFQTCTVEFTAPEDPASADFSALSLAIETTRIPFVGNRCDTSNDLCNFTITGTAEGQTFSISGVAYDIRNLLGGNTGGGFDPQGGVSICYGGTISNSTSTMAISNFCLNLDVSGSRSELLAPFQSYSALDYANLTDTTSAEYQDLENLLAEVVLRVGVTGGLTFSSNTDGSIGDYSIANLDTSFTFDREALVNLSKDAPVFIFETQTLNRTNSWGETSSSVSGAPMFYLEVDDTSTLTGTTLSQSVGTPPIQSVTNAEVQGLAPIVDVMKQYALSLIDSTVEAPVLTDEEWAQIQADVEAELAYEGTITQTVQDPDVGNRRYIYSLSQDGSIDVSQENSNNNAMRVFLSGVTGYIYADETLVATAHLGNSQDGLLLSFMDGTQRSYPNANPDPMAGLQSFLDFLEVLVPPTEETAE
ncbi:Ig-like domain-containing protein [Thalassolituus sp.]|uniref:Ig-like domain-containing protein n=1 Tax=Thalassolituus sp. TaxID=2030822 RepID=UPI0035120A64